MEAKPEYPAEFWDTKYNTSHYVYGEHPNDFLKDSLSTLSPGKILFPAEGEGRNAVYAAKNNWEVFAFDQSIIAKNKALSLAQKNKVNIEYRQGDLKSLTYSPASFDVIALIYAHFSNEIRLEYHKLLGLYLKTGGIIILEAFSKNHLEYRQKDEKVGGPADKNMLYSVDEIKSDFTNFEIIKLEEIVIDLNEGIGHVGKGSVIRFIAKKNLITQ